VSWPHLVGGTWWPRSSTVSERSVRQRSRSVTSARGLQAASWASGRLAVRRLQAALTNTPNPG